MSVSTIIYNGDDRITVQPSVAIPGGVLLKIYVIDGMADTWLTRSKWEEIQAAVERSFQLSADVSELG